MIAKLKEKVKVNYDDLIKYMDVNDIKISGSFVVQCILDEYWEERITGFWLEPGIDMYTSNYELDTNIFSMNQYKVDMGINNIIICTHDNKKYLSIDIKLSNDKRYDININILKSSYGVEKGKHILHINNLQNIFNKEITFDSLDITNRLPLIKCDYNQKGFTFKDVIIGNHIYYKKNLIPIIVLNYNLKQICMFNKIFTFDDKCIIQHFEYDDIMIEIDKGTLLLNRGNCHCDETSLKHDILTKCPITCFDSNIGHYHSKMVISSLKLNGLFNYDCIVIKYTDNETNKINGMNDMLSLYKNIFDGIENDKKYDNLFMDLNDFKKINPMVVEPTIKHDVDQF
jgi:hypothetical protein